MRKFERKYVNMHELAKVLAVRRKDIMEMVGKTKLKGMKVGNCYVFNKQQIDEYFGEEAATIWMAVTREHEKRLEREKLSRELYKYRKENGLIKKKRGRPKTKQQSPAEETQQGESHETV